MLWVVGPADRTSPCRDSVALYTRRRMYIEEHSRRQKLRSLMELKVVFLHCIYIEGKGINKPDGAKM